jgi:hypothetical protein
VVFDQRATKHGAKLRVTLRVEGPCRVAGSLKEHELIALRVIRRRSQRYYTSSDLVLSSFISGAAKAWDGRPGEEVAHGRVPVACSS